MDHPADTRRISEAAVFAVGNDPRAVCFLMLTTQAEPRVTGTGRNASTSFLRIEVTGTGFHPPCGRVFRVQRKRLNHTTASIGPAQRPSRTPDNCNPLNQFLREVLP